MPPCVRRRWSAARRSQPTQSPARGARATPKGLRSSTVRCWKPDPSGNTRLDTPRTWTEFPAPARDPDHEPERPGLLRRPDVVDVIDPTKETWRRKSAGGAERSSAGGAEPSGRTETELRRPADHEIGRGVERQAPNENPESVAAVVSRPASIAAAPSCYVAYGLPASIQGANAASSSGSQTLPADGTTLTSPVPGGRRRGRHRTTVGGDS